MNLQGIYRNMRASGVVLMIILGVAGWLRFQSLGDKCLWYNEPLSWRLMEFPVSEIIERSADRHSIHPPLYFILLHYWSLVFGQSELALRSPAAVSGLWTVGGAFFFLRELVWLFRPSQASGRWQNRADLAALLFALWVAVNPMQIELSRQVRHYSLGSALFLWSNWFLIRALRLPARPRRYWCGYGALALALCYTHYLALFSVAAQGLFLVIYFTWLHKDAQPLPSQNSSRQTTASSFRWACLIGAFLVLGYLPWVLNMVGSVEGAHRGPWRSGFQMERIPQLTVITALGLDDTYQSLGRYVEWAICAALFLAMIGIPLVQKGSGLFLLICVALPLAAVISYSLEMNMDKYLPRYLFLVQLGLMAAICLLICSVRSLVQGTLLTFFLAIWVANGLWESWQAIGPGASPGMRAAADYILGQKKTNDLVLAENPQLLFISSYYLQGRATPLLYSRGFSRLRVGEAVRLRDDELIPAELLFRPGITRIWLVQCNFNLSTDDYSVVFPSGWSKVSTKDFLRDRWEDPIAVSLYLFRP